MRLNSELCGVWVGAVVLLVGGHAASAADWGDLTAKFVFDGTPAASKPVTVDKDKELCAKPEFKLVDESLLVNPENKGIANVLVFLYLARGEKAPAAHESYKENEKGTVVLDNLNCRFEPHIVALRTTQSLVVGNKDPIGHNTNFTTFANPPQNILIPAGAQQKLNFTAVENLPVPVACNIHPWMKAHAVIKDHPYVGVSDKDGKVTLKNLPAGNWTFQLWHEASGFVSEGNQNGKPAKWERGRVKMAIKAGANDLGEIKLSRSMFEKK